MSPKVQGLPSFRVRRSWAWNLAKTLNLVFWVVQGSDGSLLPFWECLQTKKRCILLQAINSDFIHHDSPTIFFKSTFNGTTVNIILLILYHRTVHGILLVHYCIEQQFFGYKSCHNSPMSCHQLKIEQQPNGLKGHCKRLGASRCPQPQMWSL